MNRLFGESLKTTHMIFFYLLYFFNFANFAKILQLEA